MAIINRGRFHMRVGVATNGVYTIQEPLQICSLNGYKS